ncbi:MAG: ABC transporter permease subunit [Nostocaceae cyanobacterium]|nr:ABC transporter permease subunit [Nostocaceae cyanobacterium]
MNFTRISVIATNVFWEVVRDRILFIIGIYALILAAAVPILPEIAASATDKMFLDLGLGAMNILGLIVAVLIGTGLVNKEIDKRTLFVLIAKPISRSEFITGKYLGLGMILAVLLVAMTILYLGFLQFSSVSYQIASILIAVFFLFLQLCLLTAAAISFGVFTSSLLATALTLAVYFMGNITKDILKLGSLSQSPGLERLTQGLYLVLPDLSRLDLKNNAVYGMQALPDSGTLIGNAAYGLFYSAMLLAIAILIFSRREF